MSCAVGMSFWMVKLKCIVAFVLLSAEGTVQSLSHELNWVFLCKYVCAVITAEEVV